MSVIITGMNKAIDCRDCKFHIDENIWCIATDGRGCPVKSIDRLINKIESKKYNKPFGTEETRHNDTIDMCINNIKEYCEVSK